MVTTQYNVLIPPSFHVLIYKNGRLIIQIPSLVDFSSSTTPESAPRTVGIAVGAPRGVRPYRVQPRRATVGMDYPALPHKVRFRRRPPQGRPTRARP